MSNYQKVYMNQIHSSSLLCQLAQMWKGQMLCDAIIKTGSVITKAHRVVLVAACPMLQSMENAAAGSHLEVRLAADIKQDAVNTFLQYLYEGCMMLTEENCRDVEKVARLLQVDSVIKCCADFYKCIESKTGVYVPSNYKYSFQDLIEFRHVRTTDLQKMTQERMMKRTSEFSRPISPTSKRQRMQSGDGSDGSMAGAEKADDTTRMTLGNRLMPPDPWDRVPHLGSGMSTKGMGGKSSAPGVIDIVEESLELVQHDPHNKDSKGSNMHSAQKSGVSIAVASQFNTEPDVNVVNITANKDFDQSSTSNQRVFNPISTEDSGMPSQPLQQEYSPQLHQESSHMQQTEFQTSNFNQNTDGNQKFTVTKSQQQPQSQRGSEMYMGISTKPQQASQQSKPFAIGSANQNIMTSTPSASLGSPSCVRNIPRRAPVPVGGPIMSSMCSTSSQDIGSNEDTGGPSSIKTDDSNSGDVMPDLTIVKVESAQSESGEQMASESNVHFMSDTGGLDMHVDDGGGMSSNQHSMVLEEGEDLSDADLEEWAKGEMSNEGSNVSGDQSMLQSFKDVGQRVLPYPINEFDLHRVWKGGVTPELRNDPFSDIPQQHRLSMEQLLSIKLQSKSAGNFAKNVCECLFPELFGPSQLRLKYSYNGGGVKEKLALDEKRKEYLMRYVLHFYPNLNNVILWKSVIVTSVNENLRRPVKVKKSIVKIT